ncbi:MAG: hypothetical protein P8Y70_11260 [Candidatus Lokiarchaeota archaeon]
MVTRIPYVKNYYIKSWSEKISKHIRGIIIKYLKDKRSRISQMGAATYSWGFKTVGSKGFTTTSSNESKESLNMREIQ